MDVPQSSQLIWQLAPIRQSAETLWICMPLDVEQEAEKAAQTLYAML